MAAVFVPAVMIPYEQTGLVEHFPSLIVCGFIVIAALLSFFNGMVLDAIRQKERREFEFRIVLANVVKEGGVKIGQKDKR